ncbi:sigma-70 family RNA polymerase sigma factor [Paenibacillus sp. OV219]|uniref:sigma-70 family RNA polymerase sigma factor n=1 Tax=Paenibacillus sp. OV219 TaxID=1884377 RepID=UPI0008BAF05C|nr:sigma-70 family RNA polymerase sigma factor [Paenibacillus sp. OV219]SEN79891.1 RNA polymerase sigma factor, sigma-70 family [Paenibacillus sp. OV219]
MDVQNIDSASDEMLIERARLGSTEAYQELLARHRGRAFQWAKQMTPDTHLAEDIVQEALIRAFLKLGTVTDLSKFLPWFRTIVRNQALMKLRRGGPHAQESTFTSLLAPRTLESRDQPPDWGDLDTVLHHYAKRKAVSGTNSTSTSIADSPLAEWLPEVIRALGPRERNVFVKHFYEQLSPQEIAESLDTNVNTIHKTLSRIRRKAEDSRIELDIRTQIRVHTSARGGSRTVVLNKPTIQDEPLPHQGVAFANAFYHLLRAVGSKVSMAEVMGYSGYAFNLNVLRHTIGAESPMLWDWDTFISNALLNLGYHSNYVDYQHFKNAAASAHKTRNFLYTLDMIRDSIDRGYPALLSSAMSYDLAIVYGYDDENQMLLAADPQRSGEVPYRTLYYGNPKIDHAISRELYAYVLDGELGDEYQRPEHKLIRLLERVIRHADGGDYTFMPCLNGLAAYDEWIAAFENSTIDPLGNASNIALYVWTRKQAATFWAERREDPIWSENHSEIIRLLRQAELAYETVQHSFAALAQLFPFPHGGFPRQPELRKQALQWLCEAKSQETVAIGILRELLTELRSISLTLCADQTPVHHIPLSPFYSFGGNRPKPALPSHADGRFEGIVYMCGNLKASMQFYGSLLGVEVKPDQLNDPIGLLPLGADTWLVLMDRRLDLNHADWKPSYYVRVPDMDQTYERALRQKWTIINFLDKGGPFTDIFIAADAEGHQLMMGSHSLAESFPAAKRTCDTHALRAGAAKAPFALAVKSVAAAASAYSELLGEDIVTRSIRFIDKFSSSDAAARLQLEVKDASSFYSWLSDSGINVSRTIGDADDGLHKWVLADPDGHEIVIQLMSPEAAART